MESPPDRRPEAKPPMQNGPAHLYLSTLRRAVIDVGGQRVAHLDDVVVQMRGTNYPVVAGVVADVGGQRLFIPAKAVAEWQTHRLTLATGRVDLRPFERRRGELLLRADVLGHRLVDLEHRCLVRAFDVRLTQEHHLWEASGVDVDRAARLRRFRRHEPAQVRDWKGFAPLFGSAVPMAHGARRAWLRWLKPAEIADLVEAASGEEQRDILAQVHGDRDLEADVFEELEQGEQSALLRARPDAEVAEVLSRMRADDAADALMQLPTERRQTVLELLTVPQRTRVTMLLGFHAESAGGLMGVDFIGLPGETRVSDALAAVGRAASMQPQALTSVYCTDGGGRLCGAVTVVRLVQAEPGATLQAVSDPDPVRVEASADLIDLALLMTDHNLLTLPVVNEEGSLIGLVTVDDVLEALVPDHWRRRTPSPRPT